MTFPWVKLYREERGSFGQLPLMVRAMAGQLLKAVDDEGRFFVGDMAPADAVARYFGATTGDRRQLRKILPQLIDDGFCSVDSGWITVANFDRFQSKKPPRKKREPVANLTRDREKDQVRDQLATEIDSSRSPNTAQVSEIIPRALDKIRGDKRRGDKNSFPLRRNVPSSGESGPSIEVQILDLESKFGKDISADCRMGLGLSRKCGKIADSVWLTTLKKLDALGVSVGTEAMRRFADRYADGEKSEAYLVAIARGLAKNNGRQGMLGGMGRARIGDFSDVEKSAMEQFEDQLRRDGKL